MVPPDPPASEPPFAHRYVLGDEIGSGGSSRVLRAHDERLDRDVAIKLLRLASPDPSARERFVREALIGSQISHPNAVTVYDAGDDDGTLFIAMELVEGEDLAHRLRRDGRLPPAEAVRIASEVLEVLEAAHRSGVIHRDVKPSNVLLDASGTARLADFGIARPLGDLTAGLTRTGQIMGTATYLSPEQAGGRELGPPTDLYSTGVVLYEMLTGRAPFSGDHALAVALAHQEQPVPPLRQRAPEVGPGLAAAVERALAKDPDARFASAAEMREALLADEADAEHTALLTPPTEPMSATTATPDAMSSPAPDRNRRPLQRRTVLVGAAVALVVLALVLVALLGGGDPDAVVAVDQSTTSTSEPPPTTTTTSSPPTTAAPTIGTLTDRLAADPESFGKKGGELLDRLQQVQREDGKKQTDVADKTLKDLDKWEKDGDIDPGVAAQARAVLEPIAEG